MYGNWSADEMNDTHLVALENPWLCRQVYVCVWVYSLKAETHFVLLCYSVLLVLASPLNKCSSRREVS